MKIQNDGNTDVCPRDGKSQSPSANGAGASSGFEFHPATNLFPVDENEVAALAEDILAHGLKNGIVLHEKKVLDGRLRYLSCLCAGVEPRFVEWDGEGGDPVSYVVSQNLHRRHLTQSQKAKIAVDHLLAHAEDEAKARMQLSQGRGKKGAKCDATFSDKGKASTIAGKQAGVSSSLVENAARILRESPQLYGKIGTVEGKKEFTVSDALQELAHEKRLEQHEAGLKHFNIAVRQRFDDLCPIVHARFQDYLPTLKERVDCILTDPPYGAEYVSMYEELSLHASQALKPGGVLACMVGEIFLDRILPALGTHLKWRAMIHYVLSSGKTRPHFPRNILAQNAKSILVFGGNEKWITKTVVYEEGCHDPKASCLATNIVWAGGLDKTWHKWQQDVPGAEQLVQMLTNPGDLILDPFCCTGTNLVAAIRHKRRVLGCDSDVAMVTIARERASLAWGEHRGNGETA